MAAKVARRNIHKTLEVEFVVQGNLFKPSVPKLVQFSFFAFMARVLWQLRHLVTLISKPFRMSKRV